MARLAVEYRPGITWNHGPSCRGICKGCPALRRELPGLLEDAENGFSDRLRQLVGRLGEHWKHLDESIIEYNHEIELIAKRHDVCRRLVTVPGMGPLGATASLRQRREVALQQLHPARDDARPINTF